MKYLKHPTQAIVHIYSSIKVTLQSWRSFGNHLPSSKRLAGLKFHWTKSNWVICTNPPDMYNPFILTMLNDLVLSFFGTTEEQTCAPLTVFATVKNMVTLERPKCLVLPNEHVTVSHLIFCLSGTDIETAIKHSRFSNSREQNTRQ